MLPFIHTAIELYLRKSTMVYKALKKFSDLEEIITYWESFKSLHQINQMHRHWKLYTVLSMLWSHDFTKETIIN